MKPTLIAVILLSLIAVAIALLSQHGFGMRPCAWCVFQRLLALLAAAFALLGLLWPGTASAPRRLALVLVAATGIGGMVAAWYQYTVAAQQFSCAQTLADRFMTGLGLDAALPWLFGIYATCMDARVTLLGVEYALWGLALFAVLTVLALGALLRSARRLTA